MNELVQQIIYDKVQNITLKNKLLYTLINPI